MTNQKNIDAPSIGGQFGWERIGTDTDFAIPVIVRGSGVRFSPVRIVEQELIKRYEMLPQSVFQCITLKSFYLTSCETKLLNDINFNHCNSRYGDALFSTRDVIISAPDVKELSRYLNISHEIFSKGLTPQVNATVGLIKLVTEPGQTGLIYVPYILKSKFRILGTHKHSGDTTLTCSSTAKLCNRIPR